MTTNNPLPPALVLPNDDYKRLLALVKWIEATPIETATLIEDHSWEAIVGLMTSPINAALETHKGLATRFECLRVETKGLGLVAIVEDKEMTEHRVPVIWGRIPEKG